MKIRCARCKKEIVEVQPFDNPEYSDGICETCWPLELAEIKEYQREHREEIPIKLCDFCGEEDPVWVYEAADFIVNMMRQDGVSAGWASEGGFAACELCAELIDDDQPEALMCRAVEMTRRRFPELPLHILRAGLKIVHDQFFKVKGTKYPKEFYV